MRKIILRDFEQDVQDLVFKDFQNRSRDTPFTAVDLEKLIENNLRKYFLENTPSSRISSLEISDYQRKKPTYFADVTKNIFNHFKEAHKVNGDLSDKFLSTMGSLKFTPEQIQTVRQQIEQDALRQDASSLNQQRDELKREQRDLAKPIKLEKITIPDSPPEATTGEEKQRFDLLGEEFPEIKDPNTGEYVDPSVVARNLGLQAAHQLGNLEYFKNPHERYVDESPESVDAQGRLKEQINSEIPEYEISNTEERERRSDDIHNALLERIRKRHERTLKEDKFPMLDAMFTAKGVKKSGREDEMKRRMIRDMEESLLDKEAAFKTYSHERAYDELAKERIEKRLADESRRKIQEKNIGKLFALGAHKEALAQRDLGVKSGQFKDKLGHYRRKLDEFGRDVAQFSNPMVGPYEPTRAMNFDPATMANPSPNPGAQNPTPNIPIMPNAPTPDTTIKDLAGLAMQGYGMYSKMQEQKTLNNIMKMKLGISEG